MNIINIKQQKVDDIQITAYMDNAEAGQVILRKLPDEKRYDCWMLFVYEDYRNKGVGTELLKRCWEIALQDGYTLSGYASERTRSYYENLGAKVIWNDPNNKGRVRLEYSGEK